MKKKSIKGLLFVVLGYVLLVIAYFINLALGGSRHDGLYSYAKAERVMKFEMPSSDAREQAYGNYATLSFQAAQGAASVEQKYEKIGSLEATTDKFDDSEQQTRGIIKQFNALIQGEAVNSSDELRQLHLTIGVPPDNFDGIVTALKAIGKLDNFNVTKTDKTNDFLELKARRVTLEKTRDALVGLKAQGGKVEELIKLEQEILKMEGEIQGLGVQLGQFDKVNEFCTVRFNLAETKVQVVRSPYFGYLLESIHWAGGVYLMWLGIVAVGFLVVIFLLIIVEKSKIFRSEPETKPV